MLNNIGEMALLSVIEGKLTLSTYLMCAFVSVLVGIITAMVTALFNCGKSYSYGFISSLVFLPLVLQTVITLVNGNVGTGVAVAGAFSLVRFRSIPGGAKDIAIIFLSMASGLATGTGYVGVAIILTLIASLILVVLWIIGRNADLAEREIRITIPEELDYEGVFDDILNKYTKKHTLTSVKTTNMGSLFKLKFKVKMRSGVSEKAMIDEIRVRNGNLEISSSLYIDDEQL